MSLYEGLSFSQPAKPKGLADWFNPGAGSANKYVTICSFSVLDLSVILAWPRSSAVWLGIGQAARIRFGRAFGEQELPSLAADSGRFFNAHV